MKKLLLTTALIGGIVSYSSNAYAVTDAEFEALKAQMSVFANQLNAMEESQNALKAENARLKKMNAELTAQNSAVKNEVATMSVKVDDAYKVAEESRLAATNNKTVDANPDFVIPGTDTTLELGGYVKIDAIHDTNMSRDGSGEDFGLYAAIPLDGSLEDQKGGNTRIHARQTRLNATLKDETDYGDLKIFVEGDFYGADGSQNTTNAASFALRHAYGQLGDFMVGQTWSNFMDLGAYPESLDFVGVAGNTLLRQGQIRYTTTPDGSPWTYAMSIENANSAFLSNPANPGTDSGIEKFPDIVANITHKGDYGHTSVKAVGRQVEAFNSTGIAQDDEFAYAVGLSGKLNIGEKDDVRYQVAYGDGIGRYLFDLAAGSQTAGFNAITDSLETIEAVGGYASYRHLWTDSLRSNVMFGVTNVIDNPDFLPAATTNKNIMSAHGNLIWSLNDKVSIGGEYIYGHRETESGAEGNLHRIQASAQYKF